ncbi:7847_t:CDS:10 [Funneliformis geosporum]|uniref:tRNA-5-taurinomethyluridine 2-sulfurtransferase n=1 Tax=Funneliformis geosporum TaxID=1117311 RepID=A0A9W4SI05_9GLOM|nr:7847_t:CDS:10 [Funneliformis geosporum]
MISRIGISSSSKLFRRYASHFRNPIPVIVALSGGVDSSVSAHLLKRQGYAVEGVYMRNWDTTDENGICTSDQDWKDVQTVCKQLDIPCKQFDFTKEYWSQVFIKMIEDYENGITPNPDVICNREIKFGWFLNKCLESINGKDKKSTWIATGHYVQLERTDSGRVKLIRGTDIAKDQSYFLSTVAEEKLQRVLFPVGGLHKQKVKLIAREANLITCNKRESMGICFVGKKRRFSEFLEQYVVSKPGDIMTLDGTVIAKDWIWNWHEPPKGIDEGVNLLAQIRYRQRADPCIVTKRSDERYTVKFNTPKRAIAPGQNVVVWDGNWCIGSGIIENSLAQ